MYRCREDTQNCETYPTESKQTVTQLTLYLDRIQTVSDMNAAEDSVKSQMMSESMQCFQYKQFRNRVLTHIKRMQNEDIQAQSSDDQVAYLPNSLVVHYYAQPQMLWFYRVLTLPALADTTRITPTLHTESNRGNKRPYQEISELKNDWIVGTSLGGKHWK